MPNKQPFMRIAKRNKWKIADTSRNQEGPAIIYFFIAVRPGLRIILFIMVLFISEWGCGVGDEVVHCLLWLSGAAIKFLNPNLE